MTFIRNFEVQPGQRVADAAEVVDRTELDGMHEEILDTGLNAVASLLETDAGPTANGAHVSITGWISKDSTVGVGLNIYLVTLNDDV